MQSLNCMQKKMLKKYNDMVYESKYILENKINDLENIKSTFDVESMLLNIKYDQKNTDSQITKILKLEGK